MVLTSVGSQDKYQNIIMSIKLIFLQLVAIYYKTYANWFLGNRTFSTSCRVANRMETVLTHMLLGANVVLYICTGLETSHKICRNIEVQNTVI